MEKLCEKIKEELHDIEKNGIDASNVETLEKLTTSLHHLCELKEKEGKGMREYNDYGRGYSGHGGNMYNDYGARGNYRGEDYGRRWEIESYEGDYGDYGRRGVPGSGRGNYRGGDNRMREHINRISEGAEQYEYGRSRYRDGGNEERMFDGLEKLMYALCMFIQSTMEFAENPQEKEIIRKHVHKLQNL